MTREESTLDRTVPCQVASRSQYGAERPHSPLDSLPPRVAASPEGAICQATDSTNSYISWPPSPPMQRWRGYTGKSRDYDMASPDLRHQCHGNRPRERPEWALRYFEQSPKCMGIFLFSMALSTCKFCLKARIILDPLLRLEPRYYGAYRDSPISPSRCHAASF